MGYSFSPKISYKIGPWACFFSCLWAMLFLISMQSSSANATDNGATSTGDTLSATEIRLGIRPLSIKLTAAGNFLDFRFRVIDPDKAMALMKRGDEAYLIDQASGIRCTVTRTKVGPLRQTGSKPKAGKVYPILFTNTGKVIKPGSKVTFMVGSLRIEDLDVGIELPHRAELPPAKRLKWDEVQNLLLKETTHCRQDCGQVQVCFDKCEKAFSSRLNKEYQKLLYEK